MFTTVQHYFVLSVFRHVQNTYYAVKWVISGIKMHSQLDVIKA